MVSWRWTIAITREFRFRSKLASLLRRAASSTYCCITGCSADAMKKNQSNCQKKFIGEVLGGWMSCVGLGMTARRSALLYANMSNGLSGDEDVIRHNYHR